MTIINLYTHKGNLGDLDEMQRARLTEIEIWLLWKKLRLATHFSKHTTAIQFLQAVLDPDDTLNYITLSKLTDYLTKSELLTPTHDEVVVYLRFQGLGLNKVTKSTGRQHQYLSDLLSEYDTSVLVPVLSFDFRFTDHPELVDRIYKVTHDLFHIHLSDFYTGMEFDFRTLKGTPKNKFFMRKPML